ncbi:YceI family protein [Sphingobium phenoxybenzoativorans]|uniref:YceI family protein n=1 Tax=Sphingobium phenoxybenzoativorans TaxID=1592790 RepID=UPI0008721E44|nr:YceI family protein [Sphingobium phenoxybenzoativorans]
MERYSRIAIILHWTIAALLAFQISLGWGLEEAGARGFAAFQLHKSIGISILVLTLARIAVRYWKPRPAPMEGGLTGALAKAVHLGLYVFMLGGPLTGWALVSTAKVTVPTLIFGTIPLPHLPLPHGVHEAAENAHGLIAWIGIALFLLHVAGALRHHVLMRDGLIYRMVPARSLGMMLALIAAIPAGLFLGKAILPKGVAASAPAAVADNAAEAVDMAEANASDAAAGNIVEAVADNAAQAAEEAPAGPPPVWTVQPGGKIGFSVTNDSDTIAGGFSRWTADIVMDPDHPETASISVDIDLASASVGDPTQTSMLAGDEFFGVAAHPRAKFVAKGAEKTGANSYRAKGTLTLKGVSKPQAIRFTLSGTGLKRKVEGTGTIARAAFGVGNGDSSGGLAPNVSLTFAFDAAGKLP